MARLVFETGSSKGKAHDIAGSAILGRGDTVQVRVDDTKASREHCRVFEQLGRWVVADLNSRNGITVNGIKKTRHELKDGDKIAIGETVLVFQGGAKPAPAKAAAPAESAPAKAARPAQASKAKQAAFAAARADASRAPAKPAATSGDGAPEVSDKVLQFSKIDTATAKPWQRDLSQSPVWFQAIFWLVGLALMGGVLWLIVKSFS